MRAARRQDRRAARSSNGSTPPVSRFGRLGRAIRLTGPVPQVHGFSDARVGAMAPEASRICERLDTGEPFIRRACRPFPMGRVRGDSRDTSSVHGGSFLMPCGETREGSAPGQNVHAFSASTRARYRRASRKMLELLKQPVLLTVSTIRGDVHQWIGLCRNGKGLMRLVPTMLRVKTLSRPSPARSCWT